MLPLPSLRVTVLVPVEVPSKVPVKPPTVTDIAAGVPKAPKVSVVEPMAEISPVLSAILIVAASMAPVPPVTLAVSASIRMSAVLSKFSSRTMVMPKSPKLTVSVLPEAIAVEDRVAVSVVPSPRVSVITFVA